MTQLQAHSKAMSVWDRFVMGTVIATAWPKAMITFGRRVTFHLMLLLLMSVGVYAVRRPMRVDAFIQKITMNLDTTDEQRRITRIMRFGGNAMVFSGAWTAWILGRGVYGAAFGPKNVAMITLTSRK